MRLPLASARFLTIATFGFVVLMLSWSVAGHWLYPHALGIRSTGALACMLAFPIALSPAALLRLKRPSRLWLLIVTALIALGVGLLLAALSVFGWLELATRFITTQHLEFTYEVNHLFWPGLTEGLSSAFAILANAVCFAHLLWLALDLRAHRVAFWACSVACAVLTLLLAASVFASSA